MADKTTHTGSLTLRGIVPPVEARAQRRTYLKSQLAYFTRELARDDASIEITYWQGSRQLHPACEERPAITIPTPEGATPLGTNRGLLIEAAAMVIESQFASSAMLQRRMRVGFAKAGLLMQLLEERGIVSALHDGMYKRDALVSREDKAKALAAIKSEVS